MNPFLGRNFKLNGNQLANSIGKTIKSNIQNFIDQHQSSLPFKITKPKLQIINVGHNIGSLSYIRKKMQTAAQLGIQYHLHQFNVLVRKQTYQQQYKEVEAVLQNIKHQNYNKYQLSLQQLSTITDIHQSYHYRNTLVSSHISPLITTLNKDENTSALFIQLPLPQPLKPFTQPLINIIAPTKDADCLTCYNRMRVLDDKHIPELLPCTPRGVLKILDENGISIEGMNAVMIGRSDLVGKPLSHLLLNKSATITVCHKLTKDVNFYTQSADLVVAAAGAANLVKKVKPGAILIDVGISRDSQGKLSGDISPQAKKMASFYTPVPGGVGPLTVIMLMENVYHLWKAQYLARIQQFKRQKVV